MFRPETNEGDFLNNHLGSVLLIVGVLFILIGEVSCRGRDPDEVIGLGELQSSSISSDGKLIATCSDWGLHIWLPNGSLLYEVPSITGLPWAGFGWSPQDSLIAVTDYIGQIIIFSVPDSLGTELKVVGNLTYNYGSYWIIQLDQEIIPWPVVWSPNGSLIALGWADGTTHIFDVQKNEHVGIVFEKDSGADVRSIDWSKDGETIAMVGQNSTLIYDFSNKEFQKFGNHRPTSNVVFSPRGKEIAIADTDGIHLLRLNLDGLLSIRSIGSDVLSLSWSPNGELLVAGTKKGNLLLIENDTGDVCFNISGHFSSINAVSWAGSYIASSSTDQTVKIWRIDPGSQTFSFVRTFSGWGNLPRSVEWCPDNQRIVVTYCNKNYAHIYTPDVERALEIGEGGSFDEVLSATVSPDGKAVALTSLHGQVSIWDAYFGGLAINLNSGYRSIYSKWHPVNQDILAVARSRGVEVWDITNSLNGPFAKLLVEEWIFAMSWSPSGHLLALGSQEKVDIWDPWKSLHLYSYPTKGQVLSLAWSPDGKKLASISRYHTQLDQDKVYPGSLGCQSFFEIAKLDVWEFLQEGEFINLTDIGSIFLPRTATLLQPPGGLAWSPNSSMLAVATGSQGLVKMIMRHEFCNFAFPGVGIFQVDSLRGLTLDSYLIGPVRPVSTVSWSSNGVKIAASSYDGSIRIWRVGTETLSENLLLVALILFFGAYSLIKKE